MADPTATCGEAAFVIVDRIPRIYALYANAQVVNWVLVMPGGDAIIVDTDGHPTAYTSLARIQARRARHGGPRLVEVVEHPSEVQAA